jgi:N-methylhydantoinase A/oxoprolinase/acetone carboxylase beta subunit
MSNFKSQIITITLLSSTLFLSACNQKQDENSSNLSTTDQVIQELSSQPIKTFEKTSNDQHDIKLLIDYDARYTAVSEELEDELAKMKDAGTLTAEFAYDRKHDSILSALEMLKQLDLQTQQGRYIQGLLATYWEKQQELLEIQKAYANQSANITIDQGDAIQSDLQAQEQLEYWRNQYPELTTK